MTAASCPSSSAGGRAPSAPRPAGSARAVAEVGPDRPLRADLLRDLAAQIRARRTCRVTNATGVVLTSYADLAERHLGRISGFDPRMCVYSPDRVERAEMVREAAMRSRGIERYLVSFADDAEVVASLETNCHRGAVDSWMRSRPRTKLARSFAAVATALGRPSGDLMREYGAARALATWMTSYRSALDDHLTAYSHVLTDPRSTTHAGRHLPHHRHHEPR